ncbi:alpha/beta hydrolase [Histoplasma capsulatum G186AR]|uniref:Alpha/beta hydrolase n=1 Tax=Ajellomyces capsulatus (strain G186AR / H82 / ATCC MYA-2454 / RMSCC 2432) TaxID=447093 RepID=C0NJA7_AJECG|nr:alpha/beta hydrolase [Histoplasma capsulatum G186AR]EEH07948.1 alpha/beta hydrolase [Histoplasma capsulatum G186AR]
MAPGLLYVTIQPRDNLSAAQFHDWYNNEHGPSRLRLPFIKNGFRFRATDISNKHGLPTLSCPVSSPEWLAIYDVTDMAELKREPYLRLRRDDVKSQREKETMAKITIDRRLYDFVESKEVEGYVPLDALVEAEVEVKTKRVLVAIIQTLQPDKEMEFNKWYHEKQLPLLSQAPGWLRTRRFVSSAVEPTATTREYLSLHEYMSHNGPNGSELKALNATPWCEQVMADMVKDCSGHAYEHYYTFGPAPRDLASLASETEVGATSPFTSPDGLTKTLPISSLSCPPSSSPTPLPAIESYITLPDGVTLPYRLEGSTNPHAPLLLLSNSILTHHRIWDDFITSFFGPSHSNTQYRILRYLARGRSRHCGQQRITLDVLAADIIAILDALRVQRAAALIGVSLGGATVLNTALQYPVRTAAFVACDTNARSPDGNRQAWGERIAIAEGEGAVSAESGEAIVGNRLAEATVRRWFARGLDCDDGKGEWEERFRRVKDMVGGNSLEGFRRVVEALLEYDLVEEMGRYEGGPGAFLAGEKDGLLPKTMRDMVGMMRKGSAVEFLVVEGAGHLPMVERPERFAELVSGFLTGRRSV